MRSAETIAGAAVHLVPEPGLRELDLGSLGGDGPVLVTWPELPVWRPQVAADALDDLAAGCGASLGPAFDGGLYLLAFARPSPALLALTDPDASRVDPINELIAEAREAGVELGILRTERALRSPADVRALLADPLTDGELRALLG